VTDLLTGRPNMNNPSHPPQPNNIPVVILCGGKGSRIREISELVPKPMLPIGGRPILWHIMMIYSSQGFNRFVLCLGYKGEQIKDYFLNYQARTRDVTIEFNGEESPSALTYHFRGEALPEWSVTLADTGTDTLTGGRVARVAKYIDQDPFMLTYGDGVGDIDVAGSLDQHLRNDSMVTVTGVHPQSRFGRIDVDGDQVVEFTEKPQVEDGYVSGGFMVVKREFISHYLREAEDCILEIDGLTPAAADGKMSVFRHNGFWSPMDNSLEYNALNALWSSGKAPWKIW
jgi:glucose-1-phosphate cytidylyltransferase